MSPGREDGAWLRWSTVNLGSHQNEMKSKLRVPIKDECHYTVKDRKTWTLDLGSIWGHSSRWVGTGAKRLAAHEINNSHGTGEATPHGLWPAPVKQTTIQSCSQLQENGGWRTIRLTQTTLRRSQSHDSVAAWQQYGCNRIQGSRSSFVSEFEMGRHVAQSVERLPIYGGYRPPAAVEDWTHSLGAFLLRVFFFFLCPCFSRLSTQ